MVMAAWRTVATSEDGGHPCSQVLPLRLWLFFAFTQHKQSFYTVHIHAPLGGDGPGGGGLSMLLLLPRLSGGIPVMAAYSCDWMMAALYLQVGAGGGDVAVAAFSLRWILNYVFLSLFVNLLLFGLFHISLQFGLLFDFS
jgi:hypothetical protein